MTPVEDHPLRYRLANELHARPFPSITVPCRAVFLAIKQPAEAVGREQESNLAHLKALLDRFGTPHPHPGATHFSGQIGRHFLKWEQHTEFVTYTVFTDGSGTRAFDPAEFEVFPEDWLSEAPGQRITSVLLRFEPLPEENDLRHHLSEWFVPESLAVSSVLDGDAVVAADFRIDAAGHSRMAAFIREGTGQRRIGRIAQRLCEIEIYKTMSMLGFYRARTLSDRMGALEGDLTRLMGHMRSEGQAAEKTLDSLLAISVELENILAESSFRFGATSAYEAIVLQRIAVLREERFRGRQTFSEFMMRRYDPAMRTVKSTERRLHQISDRAIRAGDLLRTKVDVARSAQNQALLESMDRRADLALRLQRTVEGLSVVAISYYAVSLASYATYPLTGPLGITKGALTAVLTLPVVGIVWWMVRRIRARLH
ncbi:Uncharacterized membrane-anchored protein [Salinihabitans flavidus]|uniref:Uncharacterized membrane-anchored protein n=1 Tax=Salinihabitans flavidus TaxID=569882 RepID=A0A1H8PNM9_9RHOB|nr:DUF3422 domain-containing protein [Salinihabitans flavidus]SEO43381.1 Uncharacterized membrane-anchored protein [Salinihabitans flavidus]